MRILFLSSIYPKPHAPTRGVYCRLLCEALAKKHSVRVVSPTPWPERFARTPGSLPSAHRTADPDRDLAEYHPWYYYPPGVLRSQYDRFMWASIRRAVRRVVAEFRPDCVLSYWVHPDGAVAAHFAHSVGVPVGAIVGGSDVLLLPRDPARRRVTVRALKSFDAVFAVNRDLQQKSVALGANPSAVHAIQQGIVRAVFYPGDRRAARKRLNLPEGRNLLLWVASMLPVKGLEVLVQACSILNQRAADFQLLLVGDGPLRSWLEGEIARCGLHEQVRIVGPVAHENLPDWYRAADLTVLSSHSEGIPNVLRESIACGTPYVSTDVGGVAELTDDPAVRLVLPRSPVHLADAIQELLATRRPLDPARTPLRDWDEVAEEMLQILAGSTRAGVDGPIAVPAAHTRDHSGAVT